MSVLAVQETTDARPFAAPLLPIMGVVFVTFLVIGVAMHVLSLCHDGVGSARSWSASSLAISSPHRLSHTLG